MASLAKKLLFEPARSLAWGSIGGAYMGVGTAFDKPVRLIILQNLTDGIVWFSFDGVEDHIPLASISYIILDVTANKTVDQGWFIGEGTRIYAKSLSGPFTGGSVYVSTCYGAGQ